MFSRYRGLDPHCRHLLLEAYFALGLASAAVALIPFRQAIRFGSVPLGHRRRASIAELRWSIEASARRLPLRTKCIEQGIAMQRMLRQRGFDAQLHYGARPDAGIAGLKAHVWVTVEGVTVIGGGGTGRFAELAVFAA